MELVVNGMRCGHCEASVQRAVKRVSPQAEVVIACADGRVTFTGERWSRKFRPVVKVDRMTRETIRDDKEKGAYA